MKKTTPILKISFLFMLLVLLSFQNVISVETKNRDQPHQIMKTQEKFKSLKISPDYGTTALYFIPNEGQVHDKALFYAKASRYTLWMTKEGLVFDSSRRIETRENESPPIHRKDRYNPEGITCERDVSRLIFLNSKKNAEVVPVGRTEHKVNYFIGKDKSKWLTNIQTSRAVLYKELYRNIDLRVYGTEKQIEYDFIVRPGGKILDISFEYRDVEKTEIDKAGNLVIETKFGELEHAKPECYQVIEGEKIQVEARFKRIENNTYGFKVEEYNRNYELIIDPLVLVYSTYLGGSDNDFGRGIAIDTQGAAYVTGETLSTDFPTQNPIQGSNAGIVDVFITKVNSAGDAFVYSTYLGGSSMDYGIGIAVDTQGAAYVTGYSESTDFPTQNPIQGSNAGGDDAFIAKVNSSGSALIYSTYLGGSGFDNGRGIAVDTQGAAYVTGETSSGLFPIQNPIQGSNAGIVDVFITKVNSAGDAFVYSTYLGGSDFDNGFAIAVDTEGAAYVTGYSESTDFPTQNPIQGSNAGYSDVFITKVNSVGDAFVYSTYLGGSDFDNGFAIAVDTEGAAYVTGETQSNNFPTQNPIQGTYAGGEDLFITKVNSAGDALVYSTYLSGSGDDYGRGIAVDTQGAAYVTGWTFSVNFPIQNPIDPDVLALDVFITKINSLGDAFVFSTYLGGSGDDYGRGIAVDTQGAAYVTGETWSTDFPMQDPIQGSIAGLIEAFITKLNFSFVYSLTITTGSGGTTNPSPGTHNYDFGEEVPVTAIPNSGYQFSGWSGDASGTSNPITITMDSDKSITANFSAIRTDDGDNGKKGGCFIATAAYGSPLHPYVNTLQDFRDKYLIPNKLGRKLVDIYYRYSSSAANIIAKHKSVKAFVRINLVPFIIISYAMLHLGPAATLVMFIFIVVFSVFTILYFQNWQARNSVLLRERR